MAYKRFNVEGKEGEPIQYQVDGEVVSGDAFHALLRGYEIEHNMQPDGTFNIPGLGGGSAWRALGRLRR